MYAILKGGYCTFVWSELNLHFSWKLCIHDRVIERLLGPDRYRKSRESILNGAWLHLVGAWSFRRQKDCILLCIILLATVVLVLVLKKRSSSTCKVL